MRYKFELAPLVAWPSGKAEACKASIPSSNLGATFMLYLVSTPIGNLADITHRAIEILNSVDYILCEDTRHSLHLLNHYGVKTRCESFHKFSEAAKEDTIITSLKEGKSIALISDAGTPGICDPGERLVSRAVSEGIVVVNIPGACALISALVCSGLPTSPFQFLGFLPKKESELLRFLDNIYCYQGTSLCYVSPHQIENVIEVIAKSHPNRPLVIARELTKKFEQFLRGSAKELLALIQQSPLKGEMVLLLPEFKTMGNHYWESLTESEHVKMIEDNLGFDRKEAIKWAANERGVPKKELYQKLILQKFQGNDKLSFSSEE